MTPFAWGLALGLLVGAPVGIFVACLMMAGKRADDASELQRIMAAHRARVRRMREARAAAWWLN